MSMKKLSLSLLIAAPLLLSLPGCVVAVGGEDGHHLSSDFEDREYDNRKLIARLALDSNFTAALNKLGVADFNETYKKDNENIQVLYYRTHRTKEDGMTTKNECTYLYFVDGLLKETGNGEEYTRNMSH